MRTIYHGIWIVFLYVLLSSIFTAVHYLPTEADSLYYHIPLAESFLQGNFVAAQYGEKIHMYFPAATEALLAVQLALGVPIGFFNVFGLLALLGSCYLAGRAYDLEKDASLTFAATVSTLYGVVRWVHAQTVDIWLAAYYVALLALLKKPQKSWGYFLNVGILLGFLIGSKYSGPLFAVGLCLVMGQSFWQLLKPSMLSTENILNHNYTAAAVSLMWLKVSVAGAFTLLIGGFWYLRNWLVMGNPVYPLNTPFFLGVEGNEIIAVTVWKAFLLYPGQMIDGMISEFMIWPVVLLGMLVYRTPTWRPLCPLLFLALCNFIVFLFLPSGDSMQLHVSQYRFAYVVIIPVILAFFIAAKKIHTFAEVLPIAVFSNVLVITTFAYRPKILIIVTLLYLVVKNKLNNINA